MRLRHGMLVALVSCGLLLLAGCRSNKDIFVDPNPPDLSGIYQSTEAVGELGRLFMVLRLRTEAMRTYNVELYNPDIEVEPSEGAGTLGNDHLIINMQLEEPGDYYFQGFVSGGLLTRRLVGTFIFPDQAEQLAVEFERIGDAPELPEEDEEGEEDEAG